MAMEYTLQVCQILALLFIISHFFNQQGHVNAVPVASKPSIQIIVPNVIEVNKKTILECQTADNINDISKMTWKRRQSPGQSPPKSSSNATLAPTLAPDITIVTSDYAGDDMSRNVTYWTSNKRFKMTAENGLQIDSVSVQDEGVYCCEILMKNNDRFKDCGRVYVTVFPHLTFQGTNCKSEEEYCRTYGHLGKNLTCVASYRPNVAIKLKWWVSNINVPLIPTHTMYRNITAENGVVYHEAYSEVKYSRAGNYRYTCTAQTDRCDPGGCSVTDVVLVSRKHHLSLWWLVVPLLLIFVILFVVRWKKQSSRQQAPYPQPMTVYHPVTMDTKPVDPEKEKL